MADLERVDGCNFCGQQHPSIGLFLGTIPLRPCPNLPDGWIAVGPDAADGSLVICDLNGEVLADG